MCVNTPSIALSKSPPATEKLIWYPLPGLSLIGFGLNDAYNPFLPATVLTTVLNVTASSAALKASDYLKATSFCPGPSSWWLLSGIISISSRVRHISLLMFSPLSSGAISIYPALS